MTETDSTGDETGHTDLLLRCAQLYYEADNTQQEIAKKLHLTRWKVGRLLAEARESGLVRIEIVHPAARQKAEEQALCERFGLRGAAVVPENAAGDEQELLSAVGRSAAQFLSDLSPVPKLLGVSWGRTMDAVARWMTPGWANGVHVVQLNGSMRVSRTPNGAPELAARIASAGAGRVSLLPVPAIVDEPTTRQALEQDSSVSGVLDLASHAGVVIFGLGALGVDSVLVESGYLSADDISGLGAAGAVGDALGRFITADGSLADPSLDERTLGVDLDVLTSIHTRIAVAAGPRKHQVVRAALRRGLCTALVTDAGTAKFLLEQP
ncbi:sugar-binding transcriptional regulator [Kineosporia succinea]|uniref:Deoxyribonucleoside regulator n=1 Tax=Kineosporia succinea TaxID=84632 RepID=A0ABT9PCP0_9ACTN|nr:sugar-binding transcriptional regulator [Kineosporia succinea]MDP9830479.1 deoxyribonucleoside regulator [Kineosporia succinea]